MQKISKAEPACEPRQKLATLAFILEVSQYLYSRSVSGAGNLQLGTRISIAPYRKFKTAIKNVGAPSLAIFHLMPALLDGHMYIRSSFVWLNWIQCI